VTRLACIKCQQINFIDGQIVDFRQAHFDITRIRQRDKSTLWQTTLQRHLTAFETNFVKSASTGLLTLMTAPSSLSQPGADTTTNTAFRMLEPSAG
jgi:hypothetical protein